MNRKLLAVISRRLDAAFARAEYVWDRYKRGSATISEYVCVLRRCEKLQALERRLT